MKRLFFGIPVENNIRDILLEFSHANSNLQGIRWTPYDNLHITVFFIGDFDENMLPGLTGELRNNIARLNSFRLTFEKISLIKHRKIPRMFWAQYKSSDEFDNLIREIGIFFPGSQISLHKMNIPHITLARIKKKIPEDKVYYPASGKAPDLVVTKCVLWESVLHRDGAKHVPNGEFFLKNNE